MPGIEALANWRNEYIRKALYGSVFLGEEDAVIPVTGDLFDPVTGDLLAIPPGYTDVGFINDDGVQFPRDLETSDVMSWQSTEPTRSDDTQDTSTAVFVMQETNQYSVALYEGIPITDLGEVGQPWAWDKPANPRGLHWRLLTIGQDNYQGEPIYIVKLLPRAKVTDREDEQQNKENEIARGVTMTAYRSSEIGTSVRTWVDGPGWRLLAAGS